MENLIAEFPQQLLASLDIAKGIQIRPLSQPIHHIVVLGVGGSGIGANFVASFVQNELSIPYLVVKGYEIPAYIGKNSLVICSSYSGNTEETLIGMQIAIDKGARVICVASGGKLIAEAKAQNLDYVELPNYGAPPRACLGYSFVQQIAILVQLKLVSAQRLEDVRKAAYLLTEEQASIKIKADRAARTFVGKFPVLYACEQMEPVVVRLRQQLNENAKILCSHHSIPEMNHNELVGWREQPIPFVVVFFRSAFDHPRNQIRVGINKEIISNFTQTILEINCKGDSFIEQSLYAVHIGDWISWEVSKLRQVDAVEVKVIDFLKGQLSVQPEA
jgi:glucose/mannose-6-phosphate isomerase